MVLSNPEEAERMKQMALAKAQVKTEKARIQKERTVKYHADQAKKKADALKNETDTWSKAAGITTEVKDAAARGVPEAIEFLSKARKRAGAARIYLQRNPTTYTMGRGAYKVTRTYKDKGYKMGMASTIAAGESVKGFQQLFARETSALRSAKGAAKGESRKAGLLTSSSGFLSPIEADNLVSLTVGDKTVYGERKTKGGKVTPVSKVSENIIANQFDLLPKEKEKKEKSYRIQLTERLGGQANVHYKIQLGSQEKYQRYLSSPLMSNLFYSVGLSQQRSEPARNLKGELVFSGIGEQGPVQPKEEHPLVSTQKFLKAKLKQTQKTPWAFGLLEGSRTAADLTVVSLGVGIINLEKQAREFFQKQVSKTAISSGELLEVEKDPGSELIGGLVSGTIEGGLGSGFSKSGKQFLKAAEDYGVLGTIGNIGTYVLPAGRVKAPSQFFSVMTKDGPKIFSKQLSIPLPRQQAFVIGGKQTKEFGGKYFIGKPKFETVPYKEIYGIPAKSRGFEQAGVSATQQTIFRSHLPELEKSGLIKKGTATLEKSFQKQQRTELSQKQKLQKTLPARSLEQLYQTEETSILKQVSKQQTIKRIDPAKGSLLSNLIRSEGLKEPGLQAVVRGFKTSPEVRRDISSLLKESNVKRKMGDYDIDEVKEGLGILAAKDILKGATASPGRVFTRKGSNIAIENIGMGKSEPVINIPRKKDLNQLLEASEFGTSPPGFRTGKSFGQKFPGKTHKIKIYHGGGAKLKTFDPSFQSPAKTISVSAIQSKESLLAASVKPDVAKQMLAGAKTTMSPFGPRSPKDIVDLYVGGLKSVKHSLKTGDYKAAEATAVHLEKMRGYFNYIKWNKELAKWKPTLEFSAPAPTLVKGKGAALSIALGEISASKGIPLSVATKSLIKPGQATTELGPLEFYHVGDVEGRISAGEIGSPRDAGFFVTKSIGTALGPVGGTGNLFKITIKPQSKILRIETEMDQDLLGKAGVVYAKKKGYQAVDRPISTLAGGEGDREFVILDSKIIKSVRKIEKPPRIKGSPLSSISKKSISSSATISPIKSIYSSSKYPGFLQSKSPLIRPSSSVGSPIFKPSSPTSPFIPKSPPSSPIIPRYTPRPLPTSPPSPTTQLVPKTPFGSTGGPSGVLTNAAVRNLVRSPQPKGAIVLIRFRTDRPIRRPRKHRADFLGSTHVADIKGFRSKQDIIYGREKTYALTKKDIKKSAKGTFEKKAKPKMQLAKHINLISPSKKISL